jgi:hypothetical protein
MPRKTQAGRSDDATTSHGAGKTQEPKRKSRNAAVGFMKYSSARAAPPEV